MAPTLSDEVAFWMYTSGSTGDPKGVKHVHTSLMATARLFGQGILGISENDVVFSAAKLFFSYGLGNAHAVSDVGRRHRRPVAIAADAGIGVRHHAQAPADDLLRRAVALHGFARA